MTKTRIIAEPGLPFIDVRREFDAPRDLVFRAHMDPDLLVQWLGPGRFAMTVDRMEVRDGGRWRYFHRESDGNEYGFHGVFHGTPLPERSVQTFEFEGAPGHVSLQTLTLEEREGRTHSTVRVVHESVEARDAVVASGMGEGMTMGYDRLDELLAGLVPVG